VHNENDSEFSGPPSTNVSPNSTGGCALSALGTMYSTAASFTPSFASALGAKTRISGSFHFTVASRRVMFA